MRERSAEKDLVPPSAIGNIAFLGWFDEIQSSLSVDVTEAQAFSAVKGKNEQVRWNTERPRKGAWGVAGLPPVPLECHGFQGRKRQNKIDFMPKILDSILPEEMFCLLTFYFNIISDLEKSGKTRRENFHPLLSGYPVVSSRCVRFCPCAHAHGHVCFFWTVGEGVASR